MAILSFRTSAYSLIVSTVLASCNFTEKKPTPTWDKLPAVTPLNKLKQTEFVITLENPIDGNKNSIYAPAFLYAWDKVKEELKSSVITDSTHSADFRLLNQSNSHLNSLSASEYTATVDVADDVIIARAFFNKTLPFETKLQVRDPPIDFDKSNVAGFGMAYYDESIAKNAQVCYYRDDNHFILKLVPKDRQQEILLVKGLEKFQNLEEAIRFTNDMVSIGKMEQQNPALTWKYKLVDKDEFAIPIIEFNLETNYNNIQGQRFSTSDHKDHVVNTAYQRTGFILNENGAVVESEVQLSLDSMHVEQVNPHPKKMIFDRPFLIIIKRVDQTNPYFVMKVENAELMKRK